MLFLLVQNVFISRSLSVPAVFCQAVFLFGEETARETMVNLVSIGLHTSDQFKFHLDEFGVF